MNTTTDFTAIVHQESPYYRYTSCQDLCESTGSSSLGRHHLGQKPLDIPSSRQWYTLTNNRKHRYVDPINLNAPVFLPSKAIRISIPHRSFASPTDKGRSQSNFFDFSAPSSTKISQLNSKRIKASTKVRSSTPSSDSVWFRVRVEDSEDPSSRDEFDQNIPDHLPSSPLCPRHYKHPSGGTGDCMMHRRNKKKDVSV